MVVDSIEDEIVDAVADENEHECGPAYEHEALSTCYAPEVPVPTWLKEDSLMVAELNQGDWERADCGPSAWRPCIDRQDHVRYTEHRPVSPWCIALLSWHNSYSYPGAFGRGESGRNGSVREMPGGRYGQPSWR